MKPTFQLTALSVACLCVSGGLLALARSAHGAAPVEYERPVKEADVPAAALSSIKKLAGGAALTALAEEAEHGHTYYEGSWKGRNGNVDGLVSESGAVIEIEEAVPLDEVPAAVRAELQKAAGSQASLHVERKTLYVYEGHFKKDGKTRELAFTGEGRPYHDEGGAESEEGDED